MNFGYLSVSSFNKDVKLSKGSFEMNEEKINSIIENLRLLTDKQLDIIHGFAMNCVNKNLLDEIRNILEDNKEVWNYSRSQRLLIWCKFFMISLPENRGKGVSQERQNLPYFFLPATLHQVTILFAE